MSLLFDANLSPILVKRLADVFPGSVHVFDIGDIASDDRKIWEFARVGGITIASQDIDFLDMSLLRGSPPKLILLRIGNSSTTEIEQVLRSRLPDISRFEADPFEACLIVQR